MSDVESDLIASYSGVLWTARHTRNYVEATYWRIQKGVKFANSVGEVVSSGQKQERWHVHVQVMEGHRDPRA
jgi:hypothetical protein